MNDKTYPPYKFRKKPVVIEAWRIVPNSPQPSWVREALAKHEGVTGAIDWDAAGEGMWINTLEGCMTANEGDWLIKGIKGELYACKPDIFEATYEAVDVDADREARGVPQGWKLIKDSTHAERSWPDDVTSGQSLYSCCCAHCGRSFDGSKRRARCRVCAEAPPAPAAQAEQKHPMQLLTEVLKTDADYAWGWHCNLAMPIMDATGVSHQVANEAAARLMLHFFGVDTAQHENYRAFATQPPAAQAERVPSDVVKALRMAIRQNSHDMLMTADEIRQCEQALATQPTEAQGVSAESQAARDVLAERRRQVDAEGWTPEHDDQHRSGAMARAAAVYALVGSSDGRIPGDADTPSITERLWPHEWAWKWFKPKDRRHNLVRAGALILAEIERLDRATPPQPTSKTGGAA